MIRLAPVSCVRIVDVFRVSLAPARVPDAISAAMELIRAALGDNADHATSRAAKLCCIATCENLLLSDGIER